MRNYYKSLNNQSIYHQRQNSREKASTITTGNPGERRIRMRMKTTAGKHKQQLTKTKPENQSEFKLPKFQSRLLKNVNSRKKQ